MVPAVSPSGIGELNLERAVHSNVDTRQGVRHPASTAGGQLTSRSPWRRRPQRPLAVPVPEDVDPHGACPRDWLRGRRSGFSGGLRSSELRSVPPNGAPSLKYDFADSNHM